jgi:predicted MFS family arabinose efflux permease
MTDTSNAAPAGRSLGMALALTALLPFGLGYFMSYLFRAVNAVVAPDLVRELGLSASQLGFLTAAYLLAFSLFQLPLGILLDRYGPRRVQAATLLVAAAGAALFALGGDFVTLVVARGLIGLGFAGGLMASFKAVVIWVPEARRALANACVMALGALGLMVSTTPMEWAVQTYGWRAALFALGIATALIALIILAVVPRNTGLGSLVGAGAREQLATLARIYRDRAFICLAPTLGLSAGVHIAIQTLWAGPWARDVAGLDRAGVAEHLMLMAIAFLVGILASGTIADVFKRRGVSELEVMLGFLLVFFGAQALIIADPPGLRRLSWLVFGMSGQVAILAFPWLSSHFGAALSGRANAGMNLCIFATAFLAQWLIGWIIDWFPRTPAGAYPVIAYQTAFAVFLALELAALAIYLANRQLYRPAIA